jgi:hypothetical protein
MKFFDEKGNEVETKEKVIKRGYGHLLDDVNKVRCSKCGRKSTPRSYEQKCNMPQPDKSMCVGYFY